MPLVTKQKATGSHYTPPELARFLAERLVAEADFHQLPELRVLDPACGDGELLVALANSLPDNALRNTVITGIELDDLSLGKAQERLEVLSSKSNFLKRMDFLELYTDSEAQIGLFNNGPPTNKTIPPVDIIIANPPYVRTQVLGARKSRGVSKSLSPERQNRFIPSFSGGDDPVLKRQWHYRRHHVQSVYFNKRWSLHQSVHRRKLRDRRID